MARQAVASASVTLMLLLFASCGGDPPSGSKPPAGPAESKGGGAAPQNEIPQDQLSAVIAAHLRGLGAMEQFRYGDAAVEFRKVRELAPNWLPGSINLAIALLNDTGMKSEDAKKSGGGSTANFDEALVLLDDVLKRDPNNPYAHFCKGIILEYLGDIDKAHAEFKAVTEIDPGDAHAWEKRGGTLPEMKSAKDVEDRVFCFKKAMEANPYLLSAIYRYAQALGFRRVYLAEELRRTEQADPKADPKAFAAKLQTRSNAIGEEQKAALEKWRILNPRYPGNPHGPGDMAGSAYGEAGRYASIINPEGTTQFGAASARKDAFKPPLFTTIPDIKLPDGCRWAKRDDFQGPAALHGRVRDRFGAAIASFDANGDGKFDLFLCSAVVGPKGLRDALLINQGDGRFQDETESYQLPADRASLGVAAADFDSDTRTDLTLTGVGQRLALRNFGGKEFRAVNAEMGLPECADICLTARWLDLDQDGDLDLIAVSHSKKDQADLAFNPAKPAPPGVGLALFRNDGAPPIGQGNEPTENRTPAAVQTDLAALKAQAGLSLKLTPWPANLAGELPARNWIGVAALDLDQDRDLDLAAVSEQGHVVFHLNDRLGKLRAVALPDASPLTPLGALGALDFDGDQKSDLISVSAIGFLAMRNATEGEGLTAAPKLEAWPSNAKPWRGASSLDLDLDGRMDAIGVGAGGVEAARNEGNRLRSQTLATPLESKGLVGLAVADVVGDALPDLIAVRDGEGPKILKNEGNGRHWLAIECEGRWKPPGNDQMRTNGHGLGARIAIRGQGGHWAVENTTLDAGLAQSTGPIVLGMGDQAVADLIHVRWPDGVLQCELNVPADQKLTLIENNRKQSSCPVLFAWNGERYVFVNDFLGGGGLGYLIAPGVVSQPDRDEAVSIVSDQLKPVNGVYRLSVSEPMDEVAYLDQLELEVIDRPPGVEVAPDERFAPSGPRPTGELLAWRTTVEPIGAEDHRGRDVAAALKAFDRKTADGFRKRAAWVGYAEEHWVALDFGDRLSRFGPNDRLTLCLAGWVEYPYSQTNYAASTAGVELQPPVLERQGADGRWTVIDANPGYPAGMPRMMTLDVTGKLGGPQCRIRLRSNMEVYWDQAFVAPIDPEPGLKVRKLAVAKANLRYRGYTREISPDGRMPLLYDYNYVDPQPLARLSGRLTRYGEVGELLRADDDRLCLIGPGDEALIEFDARQVPPLPEGWSRSFVLRSVGYCKDVDPCTVSSDSVEPMPWKGMPDYPFGPEGERPRDPSRQSYLDAYQTRVIESR